jgi:hypothetical protein
MPRDKEGNSKTMSGKDFESKGKKLVETENLRREIYAVGRQGRSSRLEQATTEELRQGRLEGREESLERSRSTTSSGQLVPQALTEQRERAST